MNELTASVAARPTSHTAPKAIRTGLPSSQENVSPDWDRACQWSRTTTYARTAAAVMNAMSTPYAARAVPNSGFA